MKKTLTTMLVFLFLLTSVIADQGICKSGSDYIEVVGKTEFGIGENIGNMKVILSNTIFDLDTARITATLQEGDVDRGDIIKNFPVNNLGEANLDFNYASSKSTELKIKIEATDDYNSYTAYKTINVKPALDTRLQCDVQGYLNRPVICSWKTYDVEIDKLTSTTDIIKVTQGIREITFTPTATNEISFESGITGSVEVSITSRKEGYISDVSITNVPILPTENDYNLEIDNRNIRQLTAPIDIGTHQLKIYVDETGKPADVRQVQATITTPSAQEVVLELREVEPATFVTSYNFKQPATTYFLEGEIVFTASDKDNVPFEFKITTQDPKDDPKDWLWIIVGSSIGIVVAIIVIIMILRRKKN